MAAAACGADLSLAGPGRRLSRRSSPARRSGRSVRPAADAPAAAWAVVGVRGRAVPGGQRPRRRAIPLLDDETAAGLRRAGPRHELHRAPRGDDAGSSCCSRSAFLALAASVVTRRRGAPVVARLEQRAAAAAQGRGAARRVPCRSCATSATWSTGSPPSGRRTGSAASGRRSGSRTRSSRHLHGERVVIVANREPYIHERARRWHHRAWCTRRAAW